MSLSQYQENLKAIVEHPATRAQDPKILILTPPPINEYQLLFFDAAKGFQTPSRTAGNTKLYADAAREAAASLNLPVADVWTAFMKDAGWEEGQPLAGSKDIPQNDRLASLLSDGMYFPCSTRSYHILRSTRLLGLHCSGEGYKVTYHEVMRAIRTAWPAEDPEKIPMAFPHWESAPK